MSDATFARPYAKAVFEHAKETDQLKEWTNALEALCVVLADSQAYALLKNPVTTPGQQFEILSIALKSQDSDKAISAFIELLIENKRVLLLPEIAMQYTASRLEYEKLGVVSVRSFDVLSPQEVKVLSEKLSTRFSRTVSLDIVIDKALLGGIVIQSGDWILDGSVRSQLGQLANQLIE